MHPPINSAEHTQQTDILVRVTGGLGNQMFQYACAKALQLQTGANVKLDIQHSQWHARRPWQLDQFAVSLPVASFRDLNQFCSQPRAELKIKQLDWMAGKAQSSPIYRKLFRKLLKSNAVHPDRYCIKEAPENSKLLSTLDSPAYLDGYWQNEDYFKTQQNIIRQELTLQTLMSPSAAEFADKITMLECPISMHIRRGDYLSRKVKSMFQVMPMDYYDTAMRLLSSQNSTFVIFSDDMTWVKEKFYSSDYPLLFVDGVHSGVEDQRLLSMCHHHIIANSTFSWWGAWLGNAKDKKVVAPKHWGLSESVQHITQGIIPAEWIRV
ncbi:MAG TPA: hypothetical protein DD827_06940 [Gammaproteobacteria bacterium]|nr:hypothetical protein [Gammaproteobacteria bacterium]